MRSTTRAGYFILTCHSRAGRGSGLPARARVLDRLITHIKGYPDVHFSRMADLAALVPRSGARLHGPCHPDWRPRMSAPDRLARGHPGRRRDHRGFRGRERRTSRRWRCRSGGATPMAGMARRSARTTCSRSSRATTSARHSSSGHGMWSDTRRSWRRSRRRGTRSRATAICHEDFSALRWRRSRRSSRGARRSSSRSSARSRSGSARRGDGW